MHKWVKNDPVRLFSWNIFVMKNSYHFMFQVFLKKHVFDIMPLTFLTYPLYILRNCSFLFTTPSFHKWVKNDPHAFSMESNGNLWFLSTVAVRNKLTVDHTDYIRSVTPQEDYFTIIYIAIYIADRKKQK